MPIEAIGSAASDVDNVAKASSIADLAAIPSYQAQASLRHTHRSGLFFSDSSDLSVQVGLDPRQGRYVAFASDPTGASGAWVRQSSILMPDHFKNIDDIDDYDCLKACANYVSDSEVLPIEFIPRTYNINRTKRVAGTRIKINQFGTNGIDDIIYSQVTNLIIRMHGAKIQHGPVTVTDDGDEIVVGANTFNYSEATSVTPFFFDRCIDSNLIGPGTLDGGVSTWTIESPFAAETPSYGVVVFGGEGVHTSGIKSSHWDGDGMIVGGYTPVGSSQRTTCLSASTSECEFSENARSGLSNVGCADYRDYGSTFKRNGYGIGSIQWHSPAAGFNHEVLPNQSIEACGSVLVNSSAIDNGGVPFSATDRNADVSSVRFINPTASFDWENLTPLRATAQRLYCEARGIKVIGGSLTDVALYFPSTDSDLSIADGTSLTVTDPSLKILDSMGASNNSNARAVLKNLKINLMVDGPIDARAIHLNEYSDLTDSEIFISRKSHDGVGNDIFATFEDGATSNNNVYSTDLYRVAIDGETIGVGRHLALAASDTGDVYENQTAGDLVVAGTSAAELLAIGLTLKTNLYVWWRHDGGYKDSRRQDRYIGNVSDSATGFGWKNSNREIGGVVARATTKSFTYGIDQSSILVDGMTANASFNLLNANIPDDAYFTIIRKDASAFTLTVEGEDIPALTECSFYSDGAGNWIKGL